MRELSLHLLDIAENSISAGATRIKIFVGEDTTIDLLQLSVEDNGRGMSPEMVAQVTDPFITSRTTRKVGLGIPLLKFAAESCNGSLNIYSEVGIGTSVDVQFQRNHIDRMPLGDLIGTIFNLVVSNPQVNWVFEYRYNHDSAVFDDLDIKRELGDVPITEPDILACIKDMIRNMILEINPDFDQDLISILN